MPETRQFTKDDIEWIVSALNATPNGEILLKVQDHRIVGIDTIGRRRIMRKRRETSQ